MANLSHRTDEVMEKSGKYLNALSVLIAEVSGFVVCGVV